MRGLTLVQGGVELYRHQSDCGAAVTAAAASDLKKGRLLSESTVIMLTCPIKYVLLKLCLVSSIPRLRVENET